ncbi:FtsW/RodA/SpoVE family cell cycle protein [Deinococcus sp. QL22]|uniref:FtsW/RodA/SpoVE family cell cycle protein n=1 Tax=Deinococcus sp. QL22 TaxID=2939437 RepID=UPI0020183B5D|nr:FtsW/RodA/SpoVE family cell cycle protein [Deinococcus sp. QL22]UQN08191.1 FtsW/RodA/SpoVE family cell cycle protein [Deinococcus sp. QL22]
MSLHLLIAQALLLMLGLMGVATASPERILDHGVKVILALLVTFVVAGLKPRTLLRAAPIVWGTALVLLLLTLFIGQGTMTSPGTRRWLVLGPVQFQPSELAKLGLLLQLASFFARRGVRYKLLSATLIIISTTGLILLEPDLGTAVLTFSLGIVLMFAAGVHLLNITGFLFALGLLSLPMVARYLEAHRYILERLFGHVDRANTLPTGLDQIGMAHRDLQFGGWWGQGMDGLRYAYFAAHTDMIVASIGFALGFLGVALLLFAYWLVVSTALQVTHLASRLKPLSPDVHGTTLLATGAMFMVVGQAFVNLAVAAGILPVTGVPLPLVSYGFSSMLMMSVALGVIHSAFRHIRHALAEATGDETSPSSACPDSTEGSLPLGVPEEMVG